MADTFEKTLGDTMTNIHRRKILTTIAGGAGFLALPSLIRAQDKWPVNTIRIIVPAPAGGGVDIFCRKLAELLAPRLGTTIIMDNKAGGAGLLGVKALASAPPNGSAFGYVHTGIASIQAMGGKIDLQKELTPIVGGELRLALQDDCRFVQGHEGGPEKAQLWDRRAGYTGAHHFREDQAGGVRARRCSNPFQGRDRRRHGGIGQEYRFCNWTHLDRSTVDPIR